MKRSKIKNVEMTSLRDKSATEAVREGHLEPTADQIRKRAHEIFQARGGEAGHDLDDWLQAERELKRN